MGYFQLSNGEKLYYEDAGKGDRTIVMMHGWTSTHAVYAPCVPEISKKARCIIYDHRGHGNSKDANRDHVTMDTLASDLDELIRGLGLHGITLVGWSMGAATVMNYAARHGCGALRRIILCDMTPKVMNDDAWKMGLYQGRYTKEDAARNAHMGFYPVYEEFAVNTVPSLKLLPGSVRRLVLEKTLSGCDINVLRTLSLSMGEKDFRETIVRISVPLHYFYAVPGFLFRPALSEWYRVNVKTPYRAVPFYLSSHMMVSEHPHRFAWEILRAPAYEHAGMSRRGTLRGPLSRIASLAGKKRRKESGKC